MNRPKALILDLGNVVAYFDHRRACRQLAALAMNGLDEAGVFDAVFQSALEADIDCGRSTSAEFIAVLRAGLSATAPDEAIGRAWCDMFTLNDDVAARLPGLRAAGTRLILASNTNALHYEWLVSRFPDALACFDEKMLSFRLGCRKPEPRFFQACLAAAGATAGDCVYMDDKPEFVAAAESVGMIGRVYGQHNKFSALLADTGLDGPV